MSLQNGRRGNCAKYIQLVLSVWTKSRASTLYSIILQARFSAHRYRLDHVCIRRNFLVSHFAGSSIYNSFIYVYITEKDSTECQARSLLFEPQSTKHC